MEALNSSPHRSVTDVPFHDPLSPVLKKDLKVKPTTYPASSVNKNTSLFLKMVTSEIASLEGKTKTFSSNLSQRHVQALHDLKSYSHLTIKPADKGGCIIVMDNES